MKQEIRERIEKIRKVEVPEGYRKTKVGIIPDDWDVKRLGDIADIDLDNLSNSTNSDYSFQYISLEDVDCGTLKNTTEILFKNAPSRARRVVRKDDILLSTVRPNLKSHLLLKEEVSNWICSTGFSVVRSKENIAHSVFVFNHLFSNVIDRQIGTLIVGSNYPAINNKDVKSLLIPHPSKFNEQEKIAEILSTWDKAIELKEKLIEKKKEFKRGLMQKLLTGEMRFPEFTDKWEPATIKDIFEEVKRINDNFSMDIEILTISAKQGFLSQRDKFSKVIAGSSLKKYTHLLQNEFAYNKGNSKTAPFGCIFKLDMKEGLVPFVYICFRPTQMIDTDFFDFYFKHGLLDRQLKRVITSGARSDGLLNVSKDNFFNIKISLPSIEEQKKIGVVLRLIQNEIDYSIAELNQLKEQKKGLMQLLLTGIVRVEVD